MDTLLGSFSVQDRKQINAPFGVQIRNKLHHGEDSYFRQRPEVTGMAAEDDVVILNPYSSLSHKEKQAVIRNEASRIFMRKSGIRPAFDLTNEQRAQFVGTDYENNEQAIRETIAARIYSGDPTAKNPTPEQLDFVNQLRRAE